MSITIILQLQETDTVSITDSVSYKITYSDLSDIVSGYIMSIMALMSVTSSNDSIIIPIPGRYRQSLLNYVVYNHCHCRANKYGITQCPANSSPPVSNLEFANWLEDSSYTQHVITDVFRHWPDYEESVYNLNRDLLDQVLIRAPYD